MRRLNLLLGSLLLISLFSCTKDAELVASSFTQQGGNNAFQSGAVATDWENVTNWNISDSSDFAIYQHQNSFTGISAEIMSSGAVMIFAKGIRLDDGRILDKPQKLPYAVYPSPGRPAYHEYYYYSLQPGTVHYKFRSNKHNYVPGANPEPPASLQFRTVIIPGEFLQRMGYTSHSVLTLTYDQLVSLTGITP